MTNLEQYERIARKLGELHKYMQKMQGQLLAKYDISVLEYHIILLLWKKNALNQNDLVMELNVDKALISRQIQNMEKKDLIISGTDPDCRRKKILLLSEKSKEMIPHLQKVHEDGLKGTFSDISPESLSDFEHIIERLVEKL